MYELIVIGAGPAGIAAACKAHERGLRRILLIERDAEPGGILWQCVHNGFGLHYFNEELTGPEYASRIIGMLANTSVQVMPDTMALQITQQKQVCAVNSSGGYQVLQAQSVILAMGCRERTRGAIAIPGDRPAGIFTAGTAQKYVNINGLMPGKRVVVLGSGDIGLIMARRMTLEGAKVLACIELMPYSGGLARNIAQCLDDFGIPLYLSHTVVNVVGKKRLERVVAAKVDETRKPIPGTEISFDCDTLLLSVGLIPENEISAGAGIELDARTKGPVVCETMETSIPGVFACGNAVHVHDLVDNVTAEAIRAGDAAADYVLHGQKQAAVSAVMLQCGDGVAYTVPKKLLHLPAEKNVEISFRVNRVYPAGGSIEVTSCGERIAGFPRDYMAPGEMESIKLPPKLLERVRHGDLTICAGEKRK